MFHRPYPGRAFTDVRTHPDRLDAPSHWRQPQRIFVNSMSDLFHEDIHIQFIGQVMGIVFRNPRHSFLVLTKRAGRMQSVVSSFLSASHAQPFPNLWLGVSVEGAAYKDRIDVLRATPAAVRFLSIEPLIAPIGQLELTGIHWVIVGGESGPGARPMHPDWARSVRDQCQAAGIPFFFKQWGEWASTGEPDQPKVKPSHMMCEDGHLRAWGDDWRTSDLPTGGRSSCKNVYAVHRVGKRSTGRLLDGREWNEFPKELKQ